MIAANEMRIGDYFLCDGKILWLSEIMHLKKIKEWVYEGWHEETKQRYSINFFEAEPIILTPEILEKCGFEKEEEIFINYPYFLESGFTLSYGKINPDFWLFGSMEPSKIIFGKPVESIHQLQNLYFALTGKELEINL